MLKNRLFTSVFMMLAMAGVANAATLEIPENHFVEQDLEGCYLLKDKFDLYWFANKVNTENTTYAISCAKLTADIVVNENVLTTAEGTSNVCENGVPNDCVDGVYIGDASGFHEWTPIGSAESPFAGTFDGQGHTISGLYFNDDGIESYNVGLFGTVDYSGEEENVSVSISNVGIEDSYFKADYAVGGVIGSFSRYIEGNVETWVVKNVYNAAVVVGSLQVGGIIGYVALEYPLTMVNVYNVGSIICTSPDEVGGLVGSLSSSNAVSIKNSYNYGNVVGVNEKSFVNGDPLVGQIDVFDEGTVTVTNSFTIGESKFDGNGATAMSDTEFSGGIVFAQLHSAEDGEVWHQYYNTNDKTYDAYPTLVEKTGTGVVPMHVATFHYLEKDGATAYRESFTETIVFRENGSFTVPEGTEEYDVLGWYENPEFTGDARFGVFWDGDMTADLDFYTGIVPIADGCLQIGNARELSWFAFSVSQPMQYFEKYPSSCVKLVADIVVNENVLTDAEGQSNVDSEGKYIGNAEDFVEWTPIGTYNKNASNQPFPFVGTFDGQGHTISGLYINKAGCTGSDVACMDKGLFGLVGSSSEDEIVAIKNVGIEDSYFAGSKNIGGLVGHSTSEGTLSIENSYSAAAIYASTQSGGLAGYVEDGSVEIKNSYSDGNFKCYNSCDALVRIDDDATAEVVNSYYLNDIESEFGTAASSEAFANGTVATLLHGDGASAWGQKVGTHSHPNFYKGVEGAAPSENGPGVIDGGENLSNIKHTVTLHFSNGSTDAFEYVNGLVKILPTKDNDNAILGWYESSNFEGVVFAKNVMPSSISKDIDLYAKVMEIGEDGCYQIADPEMLFEFAAIVNGGESSACGKLTEDIEVNKNVLATAGGVSNVDATTGAYTGADSASFIEWTPIGTYDDSPFKGTFDGQGHTISGLYFNDSEAPSVGLFGYVEGDGATVSISNVGVEDSYFKAYADVGGIVGGVDGDVTLNIENVYNAATVVVDGSGYGDVGGIVGEVYNGPTLNVTNAYNVGTIIGDKVGGLIGDASNDPRTTSVTVNNSYNYGSVACSIDECDQGALVGSVADADVSVTNSFYKGSSSSGDYGTVKSATEFADGTVFAALHSAEGGKGWLQYADDAYPTLAAKTGTPMHVAVLHYSETDSVAIAYTAGTAFTLPTTLPDGSIVVGDWYKLNSLSGDTYTQIAATENDDLAFYAKAMKLGSDGYYEIADADDLYKFAEIVNSGTVTNAKAKLTADICVNACGEGESVLGMDNANVNATTGDYIGADSASFRKWVPIGNGINKFQGTFNGQGHTISGLYFNNINAEEAGLFGNVNGDNVVINSVGLVDSYIKGGTAVGGLVGYAWGSSALTISNSYNASFVNAPFGKFGGLVGGAGNESSLTISNSYNEGSLNGQAWGGGLVGYAYDLNVSNSYNAGSVYITEGDVYAGGITSEVDGTATITNSFNYGEIDYPEGNRVSQAGLVAAGGSGSVTVSNSYYLGSEANGDYGEFKSASEFADGTVLVALHEGGYVWVQAPGDKYPTIDINASPTADIVVLDWSTAADSTTLADARYTDGDVVVVKGGKQFYADGAIYEGILSAEQVAAIGTNKLYPVSGLDLEKVDGKLVAYLDGDSKETVLIPTDVHVDKVIYNRNVQANTFCTIMLPFTVPVAAVSDHSFYKFRRVATDDPDYSYVVKVTSVTTTLKANRPYIMIDSKGSSQIEFVNGEDGLTLNTTAESYEASSTADGITWKMKGVYEYKQWQTGDSEIGRAYLFTAQALGEYNIGQFAKLASGASLRPMRMYLTAETSSPNGGLNRPSRYGISSIVMPENIGIEIEDEELDESVEETTVVKRITIVPVLVQSNRWFDMKGRALNGRPTAKGTYYYNGKRIIIK